jgi:predicted phage replisome organizer
LEFEVSDKNNVPKKYYWLKLERDFFKRHDMKIIESMPNGEKYLLFYLKLLVESLDHSGHLRFSDAIPYNEQMLSVITGTDVDVVRSAVKLFSELKMMEMMDDGTMYMMQVEKMVGSETNWAEKKREYRQRLQDNTGTMSGQKNVMSDKRLDTIIKNLEFREDKEEFNIVSPQITQNETKSEEEHQEDTKIKKTRRIIPTIEQAKEYFKSQGSDDIEAETFWDHWQSFGWMRNRQPIKDWEASARTWIRNGIKYKSCYPNQKKPQAELRLNNNKTRLDI